MTCPHCHRPDCRPNDAASGKQCFERAVTESLPVSTVLDLLRANRQQQEAAEKRRGK